MPVLVGALTLWVELHGPGRPGVIVPIEEEQFHSCAVTREDAEVRLSGKTVASRGDVLPRSTGDFMLISLLF